MSRPVLLNIPNPDSGSVVNKENISLTISEFDVSASNKMSSIQTDYLGMSQVVTIPEPGRETTSSYYTPIYKEKINYDTWLVRINKNFEELS